ncbi:MAG: 2-amino-4-hydroxy-6-hydroxymethyldihydropteridine diphosphokinase [Deltaproteobacteria bacterium]|nr:MAG: 2-amino-4-hydroxy-6-hydroxymethyldihydropteridine diphosphokinase [Deltaproteobacteria bacterium]
MSVVAYIGLGSNIGQGRETLRTAWMRLGSHAKISLEKLSSPYLSSPVDMQSDNWFTNAVGMIETALAPVDLLQVLLTIEASLGRVRETSADGYQDRVLDMDLLFYGDTVINTPELTLPHPRVQDRMFVLQPLQELTADFVHPTTKQPIKKMLGQLTDRLQREPEENRQEIHKTVWERQEDGLIPAKSLSFHP